MNEKYYFSLQLSGEHIFVEEGSEGVCQKIYLSGIQKRGIDIIHLRNSSGILIHKF